jgi:hypothetical protein
MKTLSTLIQTVALDLAGLGMLGAGAYCAITGKPATVYTPLFTLGGAYLGLKVGATTTTTTS